MTKVRELDMDEIAAVSGGVVEEIVVTAKGPKDEGANLANASGPSGSASSGGGNGGGRAGAGSLVRTIVKEAARSIAVEETAKAMRKAAAMAAEAEPMKSWHEWDSKAR